MLFPLGFSATVPGTGIESRDLELLWQGLRELLPGVSVKWWTVVNDDARIIKQTLAGDASAFEWLVRRYQDRLFNMLVHLTSDPEQAEEVAQEAFVQAFTKLDSFQGRSGFYTWLYRIAFNCWISSRRRRRPSVTLDEAGDVASHARSLGIDTPLEQLEQQERVEMVRRALDQLPDEHRSVLIMREMDGCTYESIAEILGLPVGTVRSRLHRARMQLKRQMELVLKKQA